MKFALRPIVQVVALPEEALTLAQIEGTDPVRLLSFAVGATAPASLVLRSASFRACAGYRREHTRRSELEIKPVIEHNVQIHILGTVMNSLTMPQLLALAAALGWASGVRLYLVVLIVGLVGYFGWAPLPAGLLILAHPVVIAASGFMVFVEFFADKIPGLDSLWDFVHTAIRIPAGAALAASVFGGDHAAMATVAAIIGGGLAATAHVTKTTTRAAINTSPEPFSNVGASLAEDGMVSGGMWLAFTHPLVFGLALLVVLVLSVWLMRRCWRFLSGLVRTVVRVFSGRAPVLAPQPIAVPKSNSGP